MSFEALPEKLAAAVRATLQKYWGYSSLRPLQAEAIHAALTQRDALVVLPTGGGKSLCYQIPPAMNRRTDVVVSPLISLMKDQVDGLRECGYPAAALHGGQPRDEQQRIERELLEGRHHLLFVTPERLSSPYALSFLQRLGVGSFAIDEAHCISHWGHDFRPDYRQLARLRAHFPQASLHAYTATATQRVRADIVEQLGLRQPAILVGTFDRPNLIYRILPKQDVFNQTVQVLRRHKGEAAIVYCLSRADSEDMAEYLRSVGLRAGHYHAGLSPEERRRTQDDFAQSRIDIVAATVAFGMGIDRSDVRCVIHAAMPKSVEHYQQETGRAGRDGLEAECVMFYSYADVMRWEGLIERSAEKAQSPADVTAAARELLRLMQRVCGGYDCRHRALSEYFGQAYPQANCGACDVCLDEVEGLEDATVVAQKILSCVARCGERFGVGHIVDVLTGAATGRVRSLGHDQLSTFSLLSELPKKVVQNLTYQLADLGMLERVGAEYPVVKLTPAAWEVMRGRRAVRLRRAAGEVKVAKIERDAWEGVDRGLFEALRALRLELAGAQGVPAYVILHDASLRSLARLRPSTSRALPQVHGLGARKIERFGERLLKCINDYAREHGVAVDVGAEDIEPQADDDVSPPPRRRRGGARQAARRRAEELFRDGATVEEVAQAVQRALSTAWEYLETFVREQRPRDLSAWVSHENYQRVAEACRASENRQLKPIFEKLEGQVPYEQIRLVLAHLESEFERSDARV